VEEINCGLDFFELRLTIVQLRAFSQECRLLLAQPGPAIRPT
jgi:hypothetical protein